MTTATVGLTIENISANVSFDYMESFQSKAHVDAGGTQPITLGSVSEPELIIVIGDRPGITFHAGAETYEIGAYPFGVWADITGTPSPDAAITITGSGECIILAYGNA